MRRTMPFLGWVLVMLVSSTSLRAAEPEEVLVRLFEASDLRKFAAENTKFQLYRLTVLRSFAAPLQFELACGSGHSSFTVKKVRCETEGAEYRYTKLVRDSRLKLEGQELGSFLSLLDAAAFWTLPTDEWQPMGLDGSTWILEGVKDGKYHKVIRSNPLVPIEKLLNADEQARLGVERAYREGLLVSAFTYLWSLAGEAGEELY